MELLKWNIVNKTTLPKEHCFVMPVHLNIDGGWVVYEGKKTFCEKQLDLSPVSVNVARLVLDDGKKIVVPGWQISPVRLASEPYLIEPLKEIKNWDYVCRMLLDKPIMDWRSYGFNLELQLAAKFDLPMGRIHNRYWPMTFRQIYDVLDGKLDQRFLYEFYA